MATGESKVIETFYRHNTLREQVEAVKLEFFLKHQVEATCGVMNFVHEQRLKNEEIALRKLPCGGFLFCNIDFHFAHFGHNPNHTEFCIADSRGDHIEGI